MKNEIVADLYYKIDKLWQAFYELRQTKIRDLEDRIEELESYIDTLETATADPLKKEAK